MNVADAGASVADGALLGVALGGLVVGLARLTRRLTGDVAHEVTWRAYAHDGPTRTPAQSPPG